MVDPTRDSGAQRPVDPRVDGVQPRDALRPSEPPGGATFQVLLEKLRVQASRLEEDAERIARPAELADALERAEGSLRAALSLEQKLLEAFRQALAARTPGVASQPEGER